MKKIFAILAFFVSAFAAYAIDNPGIVSETKTKDSFCLISDNKPVPVLVDESDLQGVLIAARNLSSDFGKVCGVDADLYTEISASRVILAGTIGSGFVSRLAESGKLDASLLRGKTEKYIMKTVSNPLPGLDEALVIAGSDMRGTIYGIYELSEQIGVSPWYDWADVPPVRHDNLYIKNGEYTAGEPGVRYRGLFLNDEAPCLTGWVRNTYGTEYGDHRFYARVFELILRLRGNFLWPAMWGWAFYADDPLNSATASTMGVIMGTSHHEPMARNHQEWARHRAEYGDWDYTTNKAVLDKFFRDGMERAKDTEDLITIGMRGDGDTAMGAREGHDDEFIPNDAATIRILENIVANQRRIIRQVTRRPASERQQVWALYKEVQRYYDQGMKVPDDAIILLSDDNWGDIRRLPSEEERLSHTGGFGMYYHVDYVGAPRNSKWLNVSPIQHIWDQLSLTWQYGVEKLWVLNVGDLKPMEYPIDLFMDIAWDPDKYTADNLLDHTAAFCEQQFGKAFAAEAASILNLYSQYAGRVTPEMLDARTYNLETGEFRLVCDQFARLEARALRQYLELPQDRRDAYREIILFPVQALGNLYDMYYAQAMNHKLYSQGNPEANEWAERTRECFLRDSLLCREYNTEIAGGKWNGMMTQKHIGYTGWNDDFPGDVLPEVFVFDNPESMTGGFEYTASDGYVAMDAEHYYKSVDAADCSWTVIRYMGRNRSGISLQPYNREVDSASLSYRFELPDGVDSVTVHVITSSNLAFARPEGHRYALSMNGGEETVMNFNGELNEEPQNVYRIMYPTAASREIETETQFCNPVEGLNELTLKPLDPGVVLEKIVIDFGGMKETRLHMNESECFRR